MDEILKARKLREEILKRAASIQESMLSVNQSMANIQLMENKSPEEAPTTRLLDLSTDNLQQVLGILGGQGDYRALSSLSRTCRQMLQLVNSDDKCWEALCRRHWMIREPDPHSAPRMDTSLLEGLPGFGTFRTPQNSVQEDDQAPSPTPSPRGSHSPSGTTAPTCDREVPPVRSPKHRASDPEGTSTTFLSSTASGSARRAALALRLEQQQQQRAASSPGASSMEEDSSAVSGTSSLAASPAAKRSPGGGVGGGVCQDRGGRVMPPWEDEGERSSAPSAVVLEAKGGPRDGAPPEVRTSSSRRDADSSGRDAGSSGRDSSGRGLNVPGQGRPKNAFLPPHKPAGMCPQLQAAFPSPTASLLHFGSMSAATSKAASAPRQAALHTSLSLGNGWHGSSSSSMSSSRRATYSGDILGLGARRTGIMLAAGANVWRQLCKDRVQGWRLVMEMLAWLQQHNHPPTVSGSTHRLQQLIALRYLMLFTQHPEDLQWRQSMIKLDCLKSLLALTDNESGTVVEMALHVLANHVLGDQQMKFAVNIGSRLGKSFLGKLDADDKHPSIVREASRLLAILWAEDPCPEPVILTPTNAPAKPKLSPGWWLLQEFSSRGESLRVLEVQLTFEERFGSSAIEVKGNGHEVQASYAEDAFQIIGCINAFTGEWSLQRRLRQVPTVIYEGYSDRDGAWGVYRGDRRPHFESTLRGQQPRVFRLWYRSKEEDSDNEDFSL